jgi:hypothetical protein
LLAVVIRDWTGVRDQKLLFAEPFAGFSFTLKATVVETSRACWRTSIGAPAPALSGPLWCRLAARLVRAWSRCPLVPVPRPLGALGAPLPALPAAPGSLCGAGRPATLLRTPTTPAGTVCAWGIARTRLRPKPLGWFKARTSELFGP